MRSTYEHVAALDWFGTDDSLSIAELGRNDAGRHFYRGIELLEPPNKHESYKMPVDEALDAFERAIELDPSVATFHFHRGWCLYVLQRFEESADAYNKAFELDPTSARALNQKGIALFDAQRFEDAVATYERAIEVDPGHSGAYVNLANTLDFLGEHERALALYDQAIELDAGYVAFLNKAITLRQLGRHEAAQLAAQDGETALITERAEILDKFMKTYYQNPQPMKVEEEIVELDRIGLLELDDAVPPAVGFFAEVFHRHPEMRERWREVVNEQSDATRNALERALVLADDPNTLLSEMESSAARNDMLWGAFFVGGDVFYIRTLVEELRHLDKACVEQELFGAAATAKWSLSANAREDELVRTTLESMIAEETCSFRDEIRDLLSNEPETVFLRLSEEVQACN